MPKRIKPACLNLIDRRLFLGSCGASLCASPAISGEVTEPFAPDVSDLYTLRALQASLDRVATQKDLITGGPGDLGTGQWLEKEMRGAGYGVQRQNFRAPFYEEYLTKVSWNGGELSLVAQPIVATTGPSGLTAPLTFWSDWEPAAQVEGRIAVIMLPFARHSSLHAPNIEMRLTAAHQAGARAIILITLGPTGEVIRLDATPEGPVVPIPVALAAPNGAAGLLDAAAKGMTARLIVDGESSTRETFNLIGRRKGKGKTLVVSTPRSGWGPCVGQRGPAIATFVALAKSLPERFPRTNLIFLATSGQEYNNMGGKLFLKQHAPAPEDTVLWVHLGSGFAARDWHEVGAQLAALRSADTQRFLVGSENLLPMLRRRFRGQPGLERAYPAAFGAPDEMGEVLAAGYEQAFGLFGAHRFHHVASDGPDKTNAVFVRPVARAVLGAIEDALL